MTEGRLPVEAAAAGAGAASEPGGGATSGAAGEAGGGAAGGAAGAAPALDRRLRANAAFELVLFDRLPAGERRLLAGMARDPEHYGVLRPRPGSGLGLKAVDRETALLFLTLARPGPLPGYVRSRLGEAAAAAALARLVADGVLEIEREAGL